MHPDELSKECVEKAIKIFDLFEPDENDEVDEEKMVNYWHNIEARL